MKLNVFSRIVHSLLSRANECLTYNTWKDLYWALSKNGHCKVPMLLSFVYNILEPLVLVIQDIPLFYYGI